METIGLGFRSVKNPRKAGKEAARTAMEQIGSNTCHSCLVFATVGYSQQMLLDAVRAEIGSVPMIGCSAAGVITRGVADESNHAVLVVALADSRIHLDITGYPDVGDSAGAAQAIAAHVKESLSDDARFLLLFPCGLNVVADELISELDEQIGTPIPFIGGSAGENWLWEKTYQYYNWKVYDAGVSAALVSGDFRLLTDVTHGCVPIGNELEITKIEGNRVYEINNRPAMDVMAEYVGPDIWSDFGKVAVHFCLGEPVKGEVSEDYDPLIIRFIPKNHPEDKSISLPVRMNKGDRMWMTLRDRQKMSDSAQRSVKRLKERLSGEAPFLVLHFDCAGRGRVVMAEADKLELMGSLQSGLAPDVPWAGFFTYGEFCPLAGNNTFHNYTAAMAVLY